MARYDDIFFITTVMYYVISQHFAEARCKCTQLLFSINQFLMELMEMFPNILLQILSGY